VSEGSDAFSAGTQKQKNLEAKKKSKVSVSIKLWKTRYKILSMEILRILKLLQCTATGF